VGGDGGVNGILSGGMIVEDVGVAGVGELPGARLTAPGAGGTLVGMAALCDPGKVAGSELRTEASVFLGLDGPFRMSAKERWSRIVSADTRLSSTAKSFTCSITLPCFAEFESHWILERGRTAPSTNRVPEAAAIRSMTGCVVMDSFTKLDVEESRN